MAFSDSSHPSNPASMYRKQFTEEERAQFADKTKRLIERRFLTYIRDRLQGRLGTPWQPPAHLVETDQS